MGVSSAIAVDSHGSKARAVLLIEGVADKDMIITIRYGKHNRLLEEEVMPLTTLQAQIGGRVDIAGESKGRLGQEGTG